MNLSSHHAYVIEGDRQEILTDVRKHLKTLLKLSDSVNPDILEFSLSGFLIEHARMIRDTDAKTPFALPQKFLLISFDSITREAQNALLKVLEDPSPTSRFFIVTSSSGILIPTVLSRVEVVRHKSFGQTSSAIDVEKFLKSNQAKRLEMVGELVKSIADGKLSKMEARNFLNALKNHIEDRVSKTPESLKPLIPLLRSHLYSADTSASLKLLLERVALC